MVKLALKHQHSINADGRSKGIGIVVMGLTGAGKSTFISQLAPGVRIGHSLESCKQ